ncbi:hypothetical protein ACFW08_37250 [Streptomyces sp. NPDC058960]
MDDTTKTPTPWHGKIPRRRAEHRVPGFVRTTPERPAAAIP